MEVEMKIRGLMMDPLSNLPIVVLKDVNGIGFTLFDDTDVVRHQLVQRIIRAYDDHKERTTRQLALDLEEPIPVKSKPDRPEKPLVEQ